MWEVVDWFKKLVPVVVAAALAGSWWFLGNGAQTGGNVPGEQRVSTVEVSRGAVERPPSMTTAARPSRVLAHYGFGEDGYRPFAVLDFGTAVGAALPGTVVAAGEGTVKLECSGRTVLTYAGLERISVRPGETIGAGGPLGLAKGPVTLRAERGGRALDPVALLWPEMSRFTAEAGVVEKEREAIIRRAVREETRPVRNPAELEPLFREAAGEAGLDPELLKAVAAVESNFDPGAVSSKGALGLMQLMPETAESLGVSDPFDPAQNVRAGARYLRGLLDRFGNLELALAAYNAGPGTVERNGGIPPETREYVRKVLNVLESGN
ncbi:transglycosylase SLT domain-containing protein [Desulfofundulus sp. TPOSR]|uniref:transglycosylase SLT domain-containing protein n=1 Tax=Desulfofundulus sp. TPOSR TaxID=2714340 RepID=UPI001FAC52DB|nr:transglycosylase SLT domain-containing protein [Desulfofundulus sp. TPOSR]